MRGVAANGHVRSPRTLTLTPAGEAALQGRSSRAPVDLSDVVWVPLIDVPWREDVPVVALPVWDGTKKAVKV